MVTLLARSTKHYLIEVEDKNESINEKEKDHNDEGNVVEIKNNDEGRDAKPRKVLILDIVTNIDSTEPKSLQSVSSRHRKRNQQNKAFACYAGARCHRSFRYRGNAEYYCTGPDCEIDTSLDGKTITCRGKNAVCNSQGTPGKATKFSVRLLKF